MTLTQKIMRLIAPECEKQRQEFRHELAKVNAHTEDLMRTMRFTGQWNRKSQPSKT